MVRPGFSEDKAGPSSTRRRRSSRASRATTGADGRGPGARRAHRGPRRGEKVAEALHAGGYRSRSSRCRGQRPGRCADGCRGQEGQADPGSSQGGSVRSSSPKTSSKSTAKRRPSSSRRSRSFTRPCLTGSTPEDESAESQGAMPRRRPQPERLRWHARFEQAPPCCAGFAPTGPRGQTCLVGRVDVRGRVRIARLRGGGARRGGSLGVLHAGARGERRGAVDAGARW